MKKEEQIPKGQKGTLNYQPYSDEEKEMMMEYLRSKGWCDYMHWNNWIKEEWIHDKTKQYEKMGNSLLVCYKNEKTKETNH
mgnify:CR=1 FL=1